MTTTAPRYCTPDDVAHLFGTSDAPHTIPAAPAVELDAGPVCVPYTSHNGAECYSVHGHPRGNILVTPAAGRWLVWFADSLDTLARTDTAADGIARARALTVAAAAHVEPARLARPADGVAYWAAVDVQGAAESVILGGSHYGVRVDVADGDPWEWGRVYTSRDAAEAMADRVHARRAEWATPVRPTVARIVHRAGAPVDHWWHAADAVERQAVEADETAARFDVGAAVIVRDSGNAYTVAGQQIATTGRGGMVAATRNADGRAMIFYPGELRPAVELAPVEAAAVELDAVEAARAMASTVKVHGWGYHTGDPRPDCDACTGEAAAADAKALGALAGAWAIEQPAAERRELRREYETRCTHTDRGGYYETDHTAASAWLVAQWIAAGASLVTL